MGRRTLIFVGVVAGAVALGLGLAYVAPKTDDGGVAMLSSGQGVAIQLSDRPLPMPTLDLVDAEGRAISNASLAGKVVLLNFWATWCGPCREEIPMLAALQTHYGDRLAIVGLSIDESPAEDVQAFAAGLGMNYPIVMSTRALEREFGGITAVPSTFVIDPQGRILQRHLGLLQGPRTEHEVRVLAGLPTNATVEYVKDTGQVLLANAAYATEIPGIDLKPLSSALRERTLKRLNEQSCTCGCGLTVAQCRINDPSCEVSLPVAKKILEDTVSGAN
jgi:cytochrome c biogenesis protein CcmG/thiol:disulfide interchange protein DsbE